MQLQFLKNLLQPIGSLPIYPPVAESSQWLLGPYKYTQKELSRFLSHLSHNVPLVMITITKPKIRRQIVPIKSTYTKYKY